MRRLLGAALVSIAVGLLLAACTDMTTGASNVRKDAGDAAFSVTLNATGSCDGSCTVFMRWRQVGTTSWTSLPHVTTGPVKETPWSQTATGLARGRYEYQACASQNSSPFLCVGPDGKSDSTSRFTVRQELREFPLPAPFQCCIEDIAAGSDGALWFADFNPGLIGRITPTGQVTHYALAGQPLAISAGPDGALWFTDLVPSHVSGQYGEVQIGRITTAGVITEYTVGSGNDAPSDITTGSDGALWFTDSDVEKIGRITTTGQITEYPSGDSPPQSIAAGSDGAVWVTTYPVNGTPQSITSGPDGALWFVDDIDSSPAQLGRLTTAGAVSYFPLNAPSGVIGGDTEGIASGGDGALWITDTDNPTQILRVSTAGAVTSYPLPSCGTSTEVPEAITRGPRLQVWFTEQCFSGELTPAIGRLLSPVTDGSQ